MDSPRPLSIGRWYSLFQQTDLIEAVAADLGFDEAHVLSHDMGTSAHTEVLCREQEGRPKLALLTSTFLNGSLLKDKATLIGFQRMLEDPQRMAEALEFCRKMLPGYVPAPKRLAEDPVANVAMGRALRDMLPRASYTELPGVGHFVPLEAPQAVARALFEIDAAG